MGYYAVTSTKPQAILRVPPTGRIPVSVRGKRQRTAALQDASSVRCVVVIRASASPLFVHQLAREVGHFQRGRARLFLEVGAGTMSALGDLVEVIRNPVFGEARRKFSGVLRSHPIILGRRPD